MNSSSVVGIIQKRKEQEIVKASEQIVKLVQKIQINIGPIFLAEQKNRKLHTRYLQQRKQNIWNSLEEIGELLKRHRETPNIEILLLEKVLRTIYITRGEVKNIVEQTSAYARASKLIEQERQRRDTSVALLVLEIVRESGISIEALERFLLVTSPKIG